MTDTEERTVVQALRALAAHVNRVNDLMTLTRSDFDTVARSTVSRDQSTLALALSAARIQSLCGQVEAALLAQIKVTEQREQSTAGLHLTMSRGMAELLARQRAAGADDVSLSVPVDGKPMTLTASKAHLRYLAMALVAAASWLTAYVHGAVHGQTTTLEQVGGARP